MKTYSDLTDINTNLNIKIQITPVGQPDIWVQVNRDLIGYTGLSDNIDDKEYNEMKSNKMKQQIFFMSDNFG